MEEKEEIINELEDRRIEIVQFVQRNLDRKQGK